MATTQVTTTPLMLVEDGCIEKLIFNCKNTDCLQRASVVPLSTSHTRHTPAIMLDPVDIQFDYVSAEEVPAALEIEQEGTNTHQSEMFSTITIIRVSS
jgi:hypothetical protein